MLSQIHTLYDITVTLGGGVVEYPGDTPFCRELIDTIGQGGSDLSRLTMSAHAGTHIDAPAHFLTGARSIDGYEAGRFILPATVVDIQDRPVIDAPDIGGLTLEPGTAILFKTDNSRAGRCRSGVFSKSFVHLTDDAAGVCVGLRPGLVGIDAVSVDGFETHDYPVHHRLLEADIPILEGIDLSQVTPGNYSLICLPLKIKGGEASPVRAVLAT